MSAPIQTIVRGINRDLDSVSNDERAANVLLEVQFGETTDELVGRAILTALSVINTLEVNEQVLYARMIDIEETSLIL